MASCVNALLLVLVLQLASAGNVSVLVFGDSYGDTGPTWHQLQDTFNTRSIPAEVRSSAVGGTSACHWASQDSGMAMVNKARSLFPELPDGPEYVWYTLGANDIWQNADFQTCQKAATTWTALEACVALLKNDVKKCTETLLDNYWKAFPKSKVMHTGYDVPCGNALCRATFDAPFFVKFCGQNLTCANVVGITYEDSYLGDLAAKYSQPHYTPLKVIGAVQKAAGIPGADVGKPVLNASANCAWETLCVHPTYNTPAGLAWGNAFWDLYFSHQLSNTSALTVLV